MAKVTGTADLSALLRTLPAKLEQGILKGAIKVAAEVVAEEARISTRSARVASSIGVTVRSQPGLITASVQTKGDGAYLAPWEEFGVAAHLIRVSDEDRKGRTVRRINTLAKQGSLEINGKFVGPVVHHPGVRAHPFLRPALDLKQGEAIEAAARYIGERLTKTGLDMKIPDEGDDG